MVSKVKYNIKAVFLLILSNAYSAFGKAPAIRFNGKEIAVAIIKNKTILHTDSYSKPKSLIIAPLIIAIIERAMIKIVPHIMKVVIFSLGQFTRNYTQTVKRAADNKRRYAPGWVHSTCLLRGFPKGAAPHLAHDFAEQSVVCYTLCRRCPENTVAAGEGKGI